MIVTHNRKIARMMKLVVAAIVSMVAVQSACAEEISSLAQYEAAVASGKIVKMHPNLGLKFGRDIRGTLITFREVNENDYSSVLIYGADHLAIKHFKPDQAARYRVDAVFNVGVGGSACMVFIESEGVGINGPENMPSTESHRAIVFCEVGGRSEMNRELTAKLDNGAGSHGIQSASQVRKILKGYIGH